MRRPVLAMLAFLGGCGEDRSAPAPAAMARVAIAEPRSYEVPPSASRVTDGRELRAALARPRPRAIVLAPGRYRGARPFRNASGHALYAVRRGTAVLHAGLVMGDGALARGLTVEVRRGRAIAIHGVRARVLDTLLRGHGSAHAGISAREPRGLIVRRVVVRGFTGYGIVVDANDPNAGRLPTGFRIEDVDVARVGRGGRSNGTAEACIWAGSTGVVRRARVRDCELMGLWTGTAAVGAWFEDVDVDGTETGVYVEHFTRDSTFRGLRVGPDVRVGLLAEWAAPEWDGRPASVANTIAASRFHTRLVGVYFDEGTTSTTVRRSAFVGQSWAGVGDYRGRGNLIEDNDFRGIGPGAVAVRTDHLGSAADEGR